MRIKNLNKKTVLLLILVLISPIAVLGAQLESPNYKIVGATTKGGGITQSTNYSVLAGIGGISNSPRNYSTSYKLLTSPEHAFVPAVPKASCFETTTDGYSSCTTGPTELTTGGMVAICGAEGCYNKARFEISDSSYHYEVTDSRLVSYWPMDEPVNGTCIGDKDVCDMKGVNHGTVTGAPIVDGRYGKARSFNGSNQFVDVGKHSSLDLSSQGTISVWVKSNREYPSDDGTTRYRGIIAKTTGGGTGQQSYFIDWSGTSTTRTLRGSIGSPSTTQGVLVSNFPMTLDWQHIVLTFDGTSIKMYHNGSQVGSTVTQTFNAQYLDTSVTIARAFGGSYWDGLIDEVMIHNQALSASEVADLYSATAPNYNPPDTLYAVMISEDNFVSDIRYIDATTFMPESASTHNINDFMTKEDWEAETFNIRGLQGGTTYSIRIFALKGDFTQTEAGPASLATTATGSVFFDIDIGGENDITVESSPPYNISFTGAYQLIGGAAAMTAGNLIWLDAEASSEGGFAIVVSGKNGGLKSDTTSQTIVSSTANLDLVTSGFGLQGSYLAYDTSNPFSGTLTSMPDYSGTINSVGIVGTTATKVYNADGPIASGRMSLKLIAKPGTDKTPASDYEEEITIVFVPRY